MEIDSLALEIASRVIDISLITYDNPNGGIVYSCPFCYASKEVKATEYVLSSVLTHNDDCLYSFAKQVLVNK